MRATSFIIAAILATLSSGAIAQVTNCHVSTSAPTYGNNSTAPLSCDTAGGLRASVPAAGNSTNLTGINSVTPSVGSGTIDTGTLRVVLPTNQPAVAVTGPLTDTQLRATAVPVSGTVTATGPLTDTQLRATPVPVSGTVTATGPLTDTQLRATPVPVTIQTNAPINNAQVSGTAISVNAGAVDAGTQRVVQATGSTVTVVGNVNPLAVNSSGSQNLVQCDSVAVYDASTSGSTELVALTSSVSTYVCGFSILANGAVNVKLIYGTGTACATSPQNLTPAWQLTAQNGIVDGSPFFRGIKTATANALCINTSAGIAVQAIVYYSKF